jgi:hypothetical protein
LFQSKVQRQFDAQCTQGGKVYILELGMMIEKGEWWEVLEVSKAANNFSQEFVFMFCLYMGFIVLLFKSEYLDFGNSKGLQQSIKSTRLITKGMGEIPHFVWNWPQLYPHVYNNITTIKNHKKKRKNKEKGPQVQIRRTKPLKNSKKRCSKR